MQLNPYVQTNAPGMFNIESDGLIVGTAYPDPAARFALSGGWLAQSETLPMWGGVGISEHVPAERLAAVTANPPNVPTAPAGRADVSLGGFIGRATADANLTGFSVFDQNYAAINSPQSPVPCTEKGGLVNFYRLGCGIRVALAIDPTLVSLEGGLINAAVAWDYTNQKIIAGSGFPGKILAIKTVNCMVPVYSSGTGFITWNYNGAAAVVLL
jgi:hypothetical protein